MRVRAVQFRARRGDSDASLRALRASADRAARGADLVVFPEMAVTGYTFTDAAAVRSVAEPSDGPTFRALSGVAAAHRCWLVCGFPERAADRLFNSALVVDPSGALAFVYRKTLLYEADAHWAAPGDSGYRVIDSDRGAFAVGICMDLNDDRFVRWCRGADPVAIAFPTNWIQEDELVWPYWAWRMGGLNAALVAANTWGAEGEVRFTGASAILQCGRVLAAAPVEGDAVIGAIVSAIPRGA